MENEKLTKDDQVKMMRSQYALPLLSLFLNKNSCGLHKDAQLAMTEHDDAFNLLAFYISKGYRLCDEATVKMMKLPNAAILVKLYLSSNRYALCAEALMAMLEKIQLPYAFLLAKEYLLSPKWSDLSSIEPDKIPEEVLQKMFELPNGYGDDLRKLHTLDQ